MRILSVVEGNRKACFARATRPFCTENDIGAARGTASDASYVGCIARLTLERYCGLSAVLGAPTFTPLRTASFERRRKL
jgi:hypothetical protein